MTATADPTSSPDLSEYIDCAAAAKLAPGNPSIATVWRWITKGLPVPGGDRLRLNATRSGGRVLTTAIWLQQFLDALNKAHEPQSPAKAPPTSRRRKSPRQRTRAVADARRELAQR